MGHSASCAVQMHAAERVVSTVGPKHARCIAPECCREGSWWFAMFLSPQPMPNTHINPHSTLSLTCRGHLGGLLGGGAVAYLLGPRYELCRVRGRRGVWLVDDPPLEALATPPRKVLD